MKSYLTFLSRNKLYAIIWVLYSSWKIEAFLKVNIGHY